MPRSAVAFFDLELHPHSKPSPLFHNRCMRRRLPACSLSSSPRLTGGQIEGFTPSLSQEKRCICSSATDFVCICSDPTLVPTLLLLLKVKAHAHQWKTETFGLDARSSYSSPLPAPLVWWWPRLLKARCRRCHRDRFGHDKLMCLRHGRGGFAGEQMITEGYLAGVSGSTSP